MDGLCLTFDNSNGVLQPYKHLGWWKWMYRTSPYTYIIEGIVGQGEAFRPLATFLYTDVVYSAVGRSQITCGAVEYVTVRPPGGQSCQQYLGQYINQSGGYITNPNALENCQYCSYRTTDQFLQSNSNIFFSHHWRNLGFMWIYIGFNVRRRHRF
jgi:ATP-binding cassette subfamily G (WHITE) protein 2 (SNQ2)